MAHDDVVSTGRTDDGDMMSCSRLPDLFVAVFSYLAPTFAASRSDRPAPTSIRQKE